MTTNRTNDALLNEDLDIYASGAPPQQYLMFSEGLHAFAQFTENLQIDETAYGRSVPVKDVFLTAFRSLTERQQQDLYILAGNLVIAHDLMEQSCMGAPHRVRKEVLQ